jgi:phage tail protein X
MRRRRGHWGTCHEIVLGRHCSGVHAPVAGGMRMIRIALLAVGFIGGTFALLWTVGGVPQSDGPLDQVSRAVPETFSPSAFSLEPAMSQNGAVVPALGQQQVAPGLAVSTSLRPKARPVDIVASLVPHSVAVSEPVPLATTDVDVINRLRAMSYGIVEEMKKPVSGGAAAPLTGVVLSPSTVAPAPATTTASAGRSYTVQQGDSLPGIAFRFYGTTVAYLDILSVNRDLLSDPSELRAGMTLRIPDLQ